MGTVEISELWWSVKKAFKNMPKITPNVTLYKVNFNYVFKL